MKFSIITASYNSEKTIERTIQSILSQNYFDYEYIVVDGASKDSTLEIVKKYVEGSCGKMSFLSEPDKGMYDAMNKGINIAKGEIIGIVNSDDWLEPDALSIVADAVRKGGTQDIVYTGDILYHYDDGSKQLIRKTQDDLCHYSKRFDMGINHPATFVPKSVYESNGMFDTNLRLQADSDFVNRLFRENIKFFFINKVLSNQADGGASTKMYEQSIIDYKYILKKNNVCGLKYSYWMFCYRFKSFIKKYLPKKLIKKHRDR